MKTMLVFIVVMVFISILQSKPRIVPKSYTEDGYPRADVVTLGFDGVPQGLSVVMSCTPNGLAFKGNGINKSIPHEDILEITLETVDDKTDVSNFSYGKAIIGTAMLGTIGAVAGITSKKKQNLEMLVISYIENENAEYLTCLQQTKGEYPINTEAFYLRETVKRIELVRGGEYTPIKVK